MIGQTGDPQSIVYVIAGGIGAGLALVGPPSVRFAARCLGHKSKSCREACGYDRARCDRNAERIARLDATQAALQATLTEIKIDLRKGFERMDRRFNSGIGGR